MMCFPVTITRRAYHHALLLQYDALGAFSCGIKISLRESYLEPANVQYQTHHGQCSSCEKVLQFLPVGVTGICLAELEKFYNL